jgi:Methyltransferase domain
MIRALKKQLWRVIGMRGVTEYVREMVERGDCKTALDIGCGNLSAVSQFRPRLRTAGLDAAESALELSRSLRQHDDYILADIAKMNVDEVFAKTGGRRFDLVLMCDLIEHLSKRNGLELLEKCERLSSKYIIVATPNGFLEQGPEHGNEYQRHLSGWFRHDFEGLGYTVRGTMGTKFLRGYAALPKYNFPGSLKLDWVLAWLIRAERHPRHAFSLIAVKDVRGVPARLPYVRPAAAEPQMK